MNQSVFVEQVAAGAQTNQLKVLISAYACEPGKGSEPGVGWNTVQAIAQHHQIWVLTSSVHRPQIEAELAARPIPNLHFVYFDPFGWVYDWSKEGKRSLWDIHLHYFFWQVLAYFVAKPLHREIHFDLVHHVTYVKFSSPSFLSLLPIPFLWGPVGGGEATPDAFWKKLTLKAKVFEFLRDQGRHLGELDPFVALTARRSQLAWATTEDTARCLRRVGAKNIQVLSQLGLNEEEFKLLTSYATTQPTSVRFISIGRLLHWKGFHLGLQAFAQADLPPDAEFWIIGEGPELPSLQALTQTLGIIKSVKFWNRLPRQETLERLGECFALVHPSLHDSGGFVCLEAMAAGCPVICLDLGGPGVQVTAETGFKVKAQTPEQAIRDMASAMTQLAQQPELRNRMGQAGQQRVWENFSWQGKAEIFSQTYQAIATQQVPSSNP
ncbi:MAG: hypothetical protein OHK0047_42910 [Leptolyngbyaceae cyanobacterium]